MIRIVTFCVGLLLVVTAVLYVNQAEPVVPTTQTVGNTDESNGSSMNSQSSSIATYEESAFGFAFEYKVGEDGYTLSERKPEEDISGQVASLMLVHVNELPMFLNPPAYSEGPISIVIDVFENTKKQFPIDWAMEHASYSNIQMVTGEVMEMVVGGANALRYKVDGLYSFDVVVVAHGEKMYVLSASYHDTTSPTYRDFDPLLASLRFIPEPDQR